MDFPANIIEAFFALNFTWFFLAFIAICLDVITGFVIKGVMAHNVQSSIMREGLVHKAWEIAIIISSALVDIAIMSGMNVGFQMVSDATCVFILVMEVASVLENALEGNPELASAPIIRYVSQAKRQASGIIEAANVVVDDPDATLELRRRDVMRE